MDNEQAISLRNSLNLQQLKKNTDCSSITSTEHIHLHTRLSYFSSVDVSDMIVGRFVDHLTATPANRLHDH